MRKTKQRELIVNIIENSYSHPTAYDIYLECKKKIPNISLGTVYRNLNSLVTLNLIQKIKTIDNIERFDKCLQHSHFICIMCGKIIDIYDKFNYKNYIDNNKILNCKINYEGICSKCIEEEK